MDQNKTLELFRQGSAAWNTWAEDMLAWKKDLQSSQIWTDSTRTDSRNDETRAWHDEAKAEFSNWQSDESIDFSFFRFPGEALFQSANFGGQVKFNGAEFYDHALFPDTRFRGPCAFAGTNFRGEAKFENAIFAQSVDFADAEFFAVALFSDTEFRCEAKFARAKFREDAFFLRSAFLDSVLFLRTCFFKFVTFRDARFSGLVWFENTKFSGDTIFDGAVFGGSTSFRDSAFESSAGFSAISGESVFALHNLGFRRVPDFTEAHFKEAPAFDDIDLDPKRFRNVAAQPAEVGLPARWRALKRLAAQGRDDERELLFHQGEIIARRDTQDAWYELRFWAAWGYQVFSNFGRSISKPLSWLCLSLLAFAVLYAILSPAARQDPFARSVSCVAGSGDPRSAALVLSLHNAVPFASSGLADLRRYLHGCMYGIQGHSSFQQSESLYGFENHMSSIQGPLQPRLTPVIPLGVGLLGIFQTLVSTTLVFLILLAVRNHFRIK